MTDARYNVTLPPNLDADLTRLAKELETSKADIIRKAIILLKHAVDADEVKFISNGCEQRVLVK
jgi:predicted DNA-binding protein